MKKGIALLLALLLLLPAGGLALAADAGAEEPTAQETAPPVEIGDYEALRAIADDPDGSYILTADIDMAGEPWAPVSFRGTLDGAGHTLYNMTVSEVGEEIRETRDGNLKVYDTRFAGFFSVLEGAVVRDLNLKGAYLEVEGLDHCFVGLLAGYIDKANIQGCSVEGRAHLNNYAVQTGIGGLVGYGCGDIGFCKADVELIFEDRNFDARCEEFMGGILACGIANIEDCSVQIDGYDSCHGYVHNGGLVGMYYYCGMTFRGLSVMRCRVDGRIRFFEDNPNRRAYCAPYIGEPLSMPGNYYNNENEFERDETRDYSQVLLPEQCEEPEVRNTVTPPDCEHWGWVDHECQTCGYHWRDSYFPPQHNPGDWELVEAPSEEHPGLRERHCTVCDQLLESEEVPYVPPEPDEPIYTDVILHGVDSTENLGVVFRGSAQAMHTAEAKEPLRWSSDDPTVASVDESGLIQGLKRGTTTVRYVSADNLCNGTCTVTVYYNLWQWFLILFCFGWIWYI